ncbi:MAG TPA: hypothetical protein VFL53_04600 [Pseudolabrys sp.]|nr:hypothetical protein [Pseudolabrys sp.]
MKAFNQGRHSLDNRFWASHPNDAAAIAFASSHMSLEIADHCFDAFGIGLQLRAKVGQAIAGRCARYQFPPKPLFQLGEPALHCRLASAKYLACSDRAAAARNSEKVFEIIPIEH